MCFIRPDICEVYKDIVIPIEPEKNLYKVAMLMTVNFAFSHLFWVVSALINKENQTEIECV